MHRRGQTIQTEQPDPPPSPESSLVAGEHPGCPLWVQRTAQASVQKYDILFVSDAVFGAARSHGATPVASGDR